MSEPASFQNVRIWNFESRNNVVKTTKKITIVNFKLIIFDLYNFKRFKNNSDKLFESHLNRNLDPRVTNLIKGLLAISINERMEAY